MTPEVREALVLLRTALWDYVHGCPSCRGSGRLPSAPGVVRHCRLCAPGRRALDGSEHLLLPEYHEAEH